MDKYNAFRDPIGIMDQAKQHSPLRTRYTDILLQTPEEAEGKTA